MRANQEGHWMPLRQGGLSLAPPSINKTLASGMLDVAETPEENLSQRATQKEETPQGKVTQYLSRHILFPLLILYKSN